jgi:fumarate hydratase class I
LNKLVVPIQKKDVTSLNAGDVVSVSGVLVTARDAAHKYMVEKLMAGKPAPEDAKVLQALKGHLEGGVIYHCGPVVAKEGGKWRFVAAGPTTSIREEPYEGKVIAHFGVRAVLGKGGMGKGTLEACRKNGCVYLQAVGGAGTFIADAVKEVLGVYKEDFGTPEAFWVIRVEDLPAVVTMDTKGRSLHEEVLESSRKEFEAMLG